jgi:hypothetical protein
MPINPALVVAASLLWTLPAHAEDAPQSPAAIGDVVYKGVVGKVLDAVPMDAEGRVALQKTSAVVSGTLTGRSISIWAGLSLSNPILLIAGLAWGIYSATHIEPAQPQAKPDAAPALPDAPPGIIETAQTRIAVLTAQ